MAAHSEFRKGQRVIVHLKGGSKVVGKYTGKESKFIVIDNQRIPRETIRQISIYREES